MGCKLNLSSAIYTLTGTIEVKWAQMFLARESFRELKNMPIMDSAG